MIVADTFRQDASDLAVRIIEHIFPFMRATPENAEKLRVAAQRAVDECWPGRWIACFRFMEPAQDRGPEILGQVILREPNRKVWWDEAGVMHAETDVEQERRMFGES